MVIDMTNAQREVYAALAEHILNKKIGRPLLVAINGKDASGKTMMADLLAGYLATQTEREIIRISVDDFMNRRVVRYTPTESAGRSCYEYTFNFDDLVTYTLAPLHRKDGWLYKDKIFDHGSDMDMISPDRAATADAVVIIDGVFLYKHDLVGYWDVKVLLRTDDAVAIERGARRDESRIGNYAEAKRKYIDRYIASQSIYFGEEKPEARADIIIDNNDVAAPFLI